MKRLPVFFICCLVTVTCFSQDFNPPIPKKDKAPFWSWEKVYTGGGLGLQFGTVTLINVAPDIGYKITERYSAGVGLRYMYFADKRYIPPYEQNIYGGSVFNRFIVTNFFFLHGEYEVLNGPWNRSFPDQRFNLNNIWVGGGLSQGSGNASIHIMVLWNLNDEHYVPNPQIRMGVSVGL
jgi:long-subunit fatty acid transport protein